jgi:hypothetical protein
MSSRSLLALATAVAVLAPAATAQAGKVRLVTYWSENDPYCSTTAMVFDAAPGERNVVSTGVTDGVPAAPNLTPGPFCTEAPFSPGGLADAGAPITAGSGCVAAVAVAACSLVEEVRLNLGDGNDHAILTREGARVVAGDGNDLVSAYNGANDTIFCGPGHDRVDVDQYDVVNSCEDIRRH